MPPLGLWSIKLLPNQLHVLEVDEDIRVTNVALAENATSTQRSVVKITYTPQDDDDEDDEDETTEPPAAREIVLCSLIPGQVEQRQVDITFSVEDLVSLSVTGNNEVHLVGNLVAPDVPQYPESDYSGSDDASDADSEELRLMYGGDMMDEDDESEEEDAAGRITEIVDERAPSKAAKRAAEEPTPNKAEKKQKVAEGKAVEKKAEKKEKKEKKEKEAASTPEAKKTKRVTLPSGVSYEDGKVGTGQTAKAGKKVGMRYIGKILKNGQPVGKPFDSNTSGKPFSFLLGRGEVIAGWDQGVAGMQVGGERKLFIPSKHAYGNKRIPGIPAGSDLYFEVKLVEIR